MQGFRHKKDPARLLLQGQFFCYGFAIGYCLKSICDSIRLAFDGGLSNSQQKGETTKFTFEDIYLLQNLP